jgi:hypothetical protein
MFRNPFYQTPPGAGYGYIPPPTAPAGAEGFRSSKGHSRRASAAFNYSARGGPSSGYIDPRSFAAFYSSPLRQKQAAAANAPEFVSPGFVDGRGETQFRAPDDTPKHHRRSKTSFRETPPRYRTVAPGEEYIYVESTKRRRPSNANANAQQQAAWDEYAEKVAADYYYYCLYQEREREREQRDQQRELERERELKTPKANQSRQRRFSTAEPREPPIRPQTAIPKRQTPTKPQTPKQTKHRQATEADAIKAGIPAGYSIKNWDPAEEPITLLGSVFDANSLGKWIFDWTSYAYGNGTPMTDIAGELWILLIQLAGKTKRADEQLDHVRQSENRELVEDFLDSGERLWIRFKKLLKLCEEYMWKAAQGAGEKRPKTLGANSGIEFVETMFGRDRELNATEKLMANIRLWSMRFDANVDSILRNPEA